MKSDQLNDSGNENLKPSSSSKVGGGRRGCAGIVLVLIIFFFFISFIAPDSVTIKGDTATISYRCSQNSRAEGAIVLGRIYSTAKKYPNLKKIIVEITDDGSQTLSDKYGNKVSDEKIGTLEYDESELIEIRKYVEESDYASVASSYALDMTLNAMKGGRLFHRESGSESK